MAKELNTRIRLKYDSLANWTANKSVVLLEGEIGLCAVPAITTGTTTTAPTVLFKVGNGASTWEELSWGAGLAADVPSWAKAANAPKDTNTTYKLVKDTTDEHKFTLQSQEKGTSTWTIVSTITIPDNDHNDNQTIKVGDVAFGVNDVITLEGNGVAITGDKANKKITFKVEKTPEATKADTATTAEKVAKTLKFGSKSYNGSTEQTITATDINKDLTLQINGTTKVTYNGSEADTFNITASDLGLSKAMNFLGTSSTKITDHGVEEPTISNEVIIVSKLNNGDVVLYNHLEFVWDGSKWEKLGDESSYALKTITADASDDKVILLTGTQGSNGVSYDAKHDKRGPAGGAVKGATADAAISGYGATGSIKVPKVTVDEYGHTTALGEQTLTITMPSAPSIPVAATAAPENLATKAAIGTSTKYAREDHIHKMPSLDEIQANTKNNYVVFYCGTSSDLV